MISGVQGAGRGEGGGLVAGPEVPVAVRLVVAEVEDGVPEGDVAQDLVAGRPGEGTGGGPDADAVGPVPLHPVALDHVVVAAGEHRDPVEGVVDRLVELDLVAAAAGE